MQLIINLLLNGVAVFFAAYILPGVDVDDFVTALMVAVALGILNTFVKPVLKLLTLPINILTLGLFSFIVNILIIFLVDGFIDGFTVDGILAASLFSFVVALVSSILTSLVKDED